MSLLRELRELFQKSTGFIIYRRLPRGINPFQDIRLSLPNFRARVVFDIGANIGQSATRYLYWFPESHIYCFEPVAETYDRLIMSLRGNNRIHCYKLAMGAYKRKGEMLIQEALDESSLIDLKNKRHPSRRFKTQVIEIETVDSFCLANQIKKISYLKIDTEGGDLNVLKGASHLLEKQKVDVIEVEAGMYPGNTKHVPFEQFKKFLEPKSYFLFGLYEQTSEWLTRAPHLRRINPVFISESLIAAHSHKTEEKMAKPR